MTTASQPTAPCRCDGRIRQQPYSVQWQQLHPDPASPPPPPAPAASASASDGRNPTTAPAPAPTPRGGHSATYVASDNSVLVFGGNDRQATTFRDLWRLKPTSSRGGSSGQSVDSSTVRWQWEHLKCSGSIPPARSQHLACITGTGPDPGPATPHPQLCVYGGQHTGIDSSTQQPVITIYNDLHTLDLTTLKWSARRVKRVGSQSASSIPALSGFAAVQVADSQVIVIGGAAKDVGPTNDVHVLDMADLTWQTLPSNTSSSVPAAREMHSATLMSPSTPSPASSLPSCEILVSGGRTTEQLLNDSWILSLPSGTWTSAGQCPTNCGHTTAPSPLNVAAQSSTVAHATNSNAVISFGGLDGAEFSHEVVLFEPQQQNASQAPACPQCGGANTWIELDDADNEHLPPERFVHTLTPLPYTSTAAQYLLFGGCNQFEDLNDAWLLSVYQRTASNDQSMDPD